MEAMRNALGELSDETLPQRRRPRAGTLPGQEAYDYSVGGAVTILERSVPGPSDGPPLQLTIFTPAARTAALPAVYYMHGGGFVTGTRLGGVSVLLPYVAEDKMVLISVEYRLAPEHPDPAPIDDCYAGLVWSADNADDLGIDPRKLMIFGGSAGGCLAAGLALMARDRGHPTLSHQILWAPMLDDRFETPASRMLDGEGTASRDEMLYSWTAMLGARRGSEGVSCYIAPARARDLSGLPRTYIDIGSVDSCRDDILMYAMRLSQAGVNVDLHLWGGAPHGYQLFQPKAAVSMASMAAFDDFIRRALA